MRKEINTKQWFNTNGVDFQILLGDFLERFYRASKNERLSMIAEPPSVINQKDGCFLAAAVHKLASDFGLTPPEWVFDKKYYMNGDNPFFVGNAEKRLRQLYMYTSPPEFKHRNIFVDPNVLTRV
jgi:hypothetical protein